MAFTQRTRSNRTMEGGTMNKTDDNYDNDRILDNNPDIERDVCHVCGRLPEHHWDGKCRKCEFAKQPCFNCGFVRDRTLVCPNCGEE